MNNGISLVKIISGLSKTLGIVNEFLPLYKKIKPTINKSISFINSVSDNIKRIDKNDDAIKKDIITNSPTFFI